MWLGPRGNGAGTVGDDGAPCRNEWRAHGLYMTGSTTDGGRSVNATTVYAKTVAATKNTNKRQAVYESDSDDPAGGAANPPKPFQWFSRTFAFIKRAFTFVIIPFFKFVRNTFFQTRSTDDTVVDVSETHLTVSDVKYAPSPATPTTTATTTTTTATAVSSTAVAKSSRESLDDVSVLDDDTKRRRSSKRETTIGDRCTADDHHRDRIAVSDLMVGRTKPDHDDPNKLTPNAERYLRTVSDGLNDIGLTAAFVRRTYACCRPLEPPSSVAIDWDTTRYTTHHATVSPHVCGSG